MKYSESYFLLNFRRSSRGKSAANEERKSPPIEAIPDNGDGNLCTMSMGSNFIVLPQYPHLSCMYISTEIYCVRMKVSLLIRYNIRCPSDLTGTVLSIIKWIEYRTTHSISERR